MIAGYTRPQLLIRQVLEVLPDQEERTLHAFAVGPQFDLHRYTNAEERAEMIGVAFAENTDTDPAARQLVPYEGLQPNNVVDQAFTRLYGEKLEGRTLLAASAVNESDTNLFDFQLPSLQYPNRIQVIRRQAVISVVNGSNGGLNSIMSATLVYGGSGYAANADLDQLVIGGTGTGAVVRLSTDANGVATAVAVVAPGLGYTAPFTFTATLPNSGANVGHKPDTADPTPLIEDLHGSPIKPGNVVYATTDGNTTRRTVREIMREVVAAHYGTDSGQADKKLLPSVLNPIYTASSEITNRSAPSSWGVNLAAHSVLWVDTVDNGSGYTSVPAVSISDPIEINEGGKVWPAEEALLTAYLDGSTVGGVNVDVAGAGYYIGSVVGVVIVNGGTGYDSINPPRLVVSAPGGTYAETAELEAVITGDRITGVKINNPGGGYTDSLGNFGTLTGLTLVGGAGSGAQIALVTNNDSIWKNTITNHGSAYDDDVVIGAAGGGSYFAAKAWFGVNAAVVNNGGTGYAVGDIVKLVGGTPRYPELICWLEVTGETGGVVDTVSVVAGMEGRYDGTALPTLTGSATLVETGSGDDALTVDLDLGIWDIIITNPGVSYDPNTAALTFTPAGLGAGAAATIEQAEAVRITFTGGGGIDAEAYAVVRSFPSDWDGLIQGSIYDGKYGERYTLTVTKAGSGIDDAQVRIRSASGAFSANSVTVYHYGYDYIVDNAALGGLRVAFRPPVNGTPLKLGDTFSFVVTGAYLPLELDDAGKLIDINVIANGSGYTNGTYDLVIAAPAAGGVQASAKVTIAAGAVTPTSIVITNPGSGYLAGPTVTLPVAAGAGTGAVFDPLLSTAENSRDLTIVQSGAYVGPKNTRYQIKVVKGTDLNVAEESFDGAIVRVSDSSGIDEIQEYTLVQGQEYNLGTYGLKFMFPADQATPSGILGGTQATGSVNLSGGGVVSVAITDKGSGYTQAPAVSFSGDGVGATATAVVHAGKVISVIITNAGSGYSICTMSFVGGSTGFQGGLRTGDAYYVDAVAEAAVGPYSLIVLNGQAADITGWTEVDLALNKFDIDVRSLYSGIISPRRDSPPNLAWEAGTAADGGILLEAKLMLEITDRDPGYEWVTVKDGLQSKLFAHWRGLVPATSGDKIRLYYSEQGITEAFGKDDLDNPVCHAAILAFRGGQEKPIFVAKLASDDVAGHTLMIRQAEHVEGIYSIALTTYDLSIKELWAAHVSKMSLENWKLWRRLYVATQNPGPYATMTTKSDGSDFNATVTTNASGNVRVICADGDFVTRGIRPGDLYRTNFFYDAWGDPSYEEYEVYTVNTEDELILKTGPALPISPAIKFEIWRADSGLSQAEYVGEQSDNFLNRRVCNIWADEPNMVDADGTLYIVPVYYLAAEVAGLRAAVLPQQGLTYTELDHALDGAPLMFTKYSEEELNLAASMGTWIVTQEQEDGPIFIRHQLTTETTKGILYYEDSVGTNVDNIAYAVKDIFQPYIGRRNTNVETLEEMETKLRDLLDGFKNNPGGFTNIGPALITWRDLSITIDPVFKDRINVKVTLELPLPINTIIVTLLATTASDETIATINATVNTPAATA